MKRVVVLINSFRRKSGVHPVMSPRQILFGKKFKTPLCQIGELVTTYDVTASNKTTSAKDASNTAAAALNNRSEEATEE